MDRTERIAIFVGLTKMANLAKHHNCGLLLSLCLCLLVTVADGQYFRTSQNWKGHRNELTVGLGVSNFLGELGGRDQIGSPFIWDLELSETKPALSVGYRYYVARKQSLRANLTYGILSGNDNLTDEPFRRNRNLHFKSDLIELAAVYEFHLFEEELGHVYNLRGVKGQGSTRVGLYVFAGVGGIYFNPKAQLNNTWVALRPLNTEGQGLVDGPEEYSNFAIVIPSGVGLRYALSKQWSVGIEGQYTKTFTDYIDDVSGEYYNNAAIASNFGAQAAYFADPSLDFIPGATNAGQQRGDSTDNDAYLFFKATLHHKLYKYRSSSKKYRTRIRRQKIVF
jgi:opacity protein-like surface antigen